MTNQTPESVIAEALSSAGAPLMHSRVEEGVASALRAANMLREPGVPDAATEELARIKPLFENYSREYPNECNKRVNAEAERDAATAAITRVRAVLSAWEMVQARNRECLESGNPGMFVPIDCTGGLRAALDGAPEPDDEPCSIEIHSWDTRAFRPEQIDSYWIRCTLLGKHDDHEDSNTGLKWRSGLPVEGES